MFTSIRIKELKRKMLHAQSKKKEFSDYLYDLVSRHKNGEIDNYSFLEFFYKKMDGKNVHEWMDHLDDYVKDCKREINRERIRVLKSNSTLLIFFLLAFLAAFLFFVRFL
jgi:hypothetical protein